MLDWFKNNLVASYISKASRAMPNTVSTYTVAVGRKNYLFCGSHESVQRDAIIYSLLGTCNLQNINPQDWLNDLLIKLPSPKANNIDYLLPQNWNPDIQDVVQRVFTN